MADRTGSLGPITEIFLQATEGIEPVYFQLPIAGQPHPKFLERVYCYELYHQMRLRWPETPYRITGEIDKTGHPWIYHGALDASKPDFTIHIPGCMADNLIVIEVKAPDPADGRILADLRKLTGFCRTANYEAAYYLIYGRDEEGARDLALRCRTLAANDVEIDLYRIVLFNHTKARSRASKIDWPD